MITLVFKHPSNKITKQFRSSQRLEALTKTLSTRLKNKQVASFHVHPSSITIHCVDSYYRSLQF